MTDHLTYDPARRVLLDENGLAFARDIGPADAIRVTEALSICADLPQVMRDTLEAHVYDTGNGDQIPDDDPLEDFARRAENVMADVPEGAPPIATTEPLFALLDEMLAFEAEAFENDGSVNGAGMVDAFVSFRARLRIALEDRRAAVAGFSAPPIGLLEIAEDLSASISGLDHQIEQMKGMFPDDDGTIRQAQDDGDEARQRLAMYRKATAAGPLHLYVTVEGGNVQGVICDRPAGGVKVTVIDYDVDDEDQAVVEVHQEGGRWEQARADEFSIDVEPVPVMRGVEES